MATTNRPQTAIDRPWNSTVESCTNCECETTHEVTIGFRSESANPDHIGCSREPYRIAMCLRCSKETVLCMNNP